MKPEEIVRFVAEWCSKHGQSESVFLTPQPSHYVYTFDLFDALAEKTGITKKQIGEWFNEEQERETSRREKRRQELAQRRARRG